MLAPLRKQFVESSYRTREEAKRGEGRREEGRRGETHYYDVSSLLLLNMLVHLLPFVILRIDLG